MSTINRSPSTEGWAKRPQVNLGFGARSALFSRLLEAQRLTGRTPTRIVREVLEDYLGLWVAARTRERRAIEAARHALQVRTRDER